MKKNPRIRAICRSFLDVLEDRYLLSRDVSLPLGPRVAAEVSQFVARTPIRPVDLAASPLNASNQGSHAVDHSRGVIGGVSDFSGNQIQGFTHAHLGTLVLVQSSILPTQQAGGGGRGQWGWQDDTPGMVVLTSYAPKIDRLSPPSPFAMQMGKSGPGGTDRSVHLNGSQDSALVFLEQTQVPTDLVPRLREMIVRPANDLHFILASPSSSDGLGFLISSLSQPVMISARPDTSDVATNCENAAYFQPPGALGRTTALMGLRGLLGFHSTSDIGIAESAGMIQANVLANFHGTAISTVLTGGRARGAPNDSFEPNTSSSMLSAYGQVQDEVQPQAAGLIAETAPFDQATLHWAIDTFFASLADQSLSDPVTRSRMHVVPGSLALVSALLALKLVRRRYHSRDEFALGNSTAISLSRERLMGFPELPGSWPPRLS